MSIRTFCDICGSELTRNMVEERLIVNSHDFKAEVVVSKDGTSNDGDLCLDCLLKMLNQKPKRKYEKKSTYLPLLSTKTSSSNVPAEISTSDEKIVKTPSEAPIVKNKVNKLTGAKLEPAIPDLISTFSVITGQDGKPHTLKIGDASISAKTLKDGVRDLFFLTGLNKEDVEDAPESEGKRLLLKIFNPKKGE